MHAGEQRSVDLPLPDLYTHSHMSMPVYVVHGREAGPRLFVSAAIHGDEINGVEIIRRLVRTKYLKSLRGTLLAVPVVNPFGFINKSRYLPDRRDMNRSFPGNPQGSLAAQIAHQFLEEVACLCTHGIDLHAAAIGRTNLPQIRIHLGNNDDPVIQGMATAFNAPVILNAGLRDGSLRKAASERGVKVILYEAGEALRFDEIPIRAGVKGILSVMRYLGMLPGNKRQRIHGNGIEPLFSSSSSWVRASQSGILRVATPMGHHVNNGDLLGHIANPFGGNEETVHASTSGIIIGRSTLPLVHKGEAIFHIARIDAEGSAALSTLQQFQHEMDPDMENPFQ
ncbi:MAG: succinylglutamate desuccinylase/aspartoacylase family protein [Thiolinea sp.]